jgi:hypothetical protein
VKRTGFILFCFIHLCTNALLQSKIINLSDNDFRITMTFAQSAINDWQQGNFNCLEANTTFDFNQVIYIDTLKVKSQLKGALGFLYKKESKTSLETYLPTENKIYNEIVLSYPLGWKVDPFFSFSIATHTIESYKYVNKIKVVTANFWDPVTLQQNLGFEKSIKMKQYTFTGNLGLSLKQIRTDKNTLLSDDRITKDIIEKYKTESGIRLKSELTWDLTKTINYRGGLELFGTLDDLNKWTIKNNNSFKISIYKYIAVLLSFDVGYDENQAKYIQYKQNINLGLVADF